MMYVKLDEAQQEAIAARFNISPASAMISLEESQSRMTTLALGEEDLATTMAIGEEC